MDRPVRVKWDKKMNRPVRVGGDRPVRVKWDFFKGSPGKSSMGEKGIDRSELNDEQKGIDQ